MANREGVPPLLDALVGHTNNLSRMKNCFYRFLMRCLMQKTENNTNVTSK